VARQGQQPTRQMRRWGFDLGDKEAGHEGMGSKAIRVRSSEWNRRFRTAYTSSRLRPPAGNRVTASWCVPGLNQKEVEGIYLQLRDESKARIDSNFLGIRKLPTCLHSLI